MRPGIQIILNQFGDQILRQQAIKELPEFGHRIDLRIKTS
jgi:hypothetical protein